MSEIKIHVIHTGKVCVAPELPFGGDHCSPLKASGFFGRRSKRLWLPVSSYLIECSHGLFLFDCGWHRNMSPNGVPDRKAQIGSLGSWELYEVNQGFVPDGQAIDEQLETMGIRPRDLDAVMISHLDCDHANGLKLVTDAQRIIVSRAELEFAYSGGLVNQIRYYPKWWEGTKIEGVDWNGTEGPFGRSYDLFGDGMLVMVNIPGHSDGLCALKITGDDGRFVLLFADGGYARKSWEQQIASGIAEDKAQQKTSLSWIRDQSLDPLCVESMANHDPDIAPHIVTL